MFGRRRTRGSVEPVARLASRLAAVALAVTLTVLAPAPAAAAEFAASLRVAGSHGEPNRDGLFYLREPADESLQELSLGFAHDGLVGRAGVYSHRRSDGEVVDKALLKELYWDTEWAGWDLTLGKKRLSWGVGFGFRPLDVITPEPRRALIMPPLEGLPLVAVERYTGEAAVTALCGRAAGESGQCALRYFGLLGDWDVQALAHAAEPVRYQLGAGFSRVLGESLSLHGELLYQREYRQWINTLTETGGVLAGADPMVERVREHGVKLLLGAGYSWRSGHNLLIEYWHDDAGYSRAQWRALRGLLQAQHAQLGHAPPAAVFANLAANMRYLEQPNLLADNLLLRWSFDGGRTDPAVDLLYTPADGGAALTLGARSELGARFRLDYGVRLYGGADDSVYRALPDRYRAYLTLTGVFDG